MYMDINVKSWNKRNRNGGWNMGNGDIMEMVTQELEDGKVDECEDDQIRKRVWTWWAKEK